MNIYLKPKIFRALKLSTLCLILGVEAGFATESYSQKTTFTISVQDQSVKEVFDYIEQHSEFIIFYLDETIDVNRKVSVNLKGQRVESILEQLFKNTDVTYTINDRQILLSKRKEVTEAAPVVAVVQQKKNTVTGIVLDPTGMPVIGANIMVKGTTSGTITDMDGKFSLDVDKDVTLVISYIGFASQEIKVGNQTKLSISLKEDSEALDELVVVGYGTQRKGNLTGAVSSVKSEALVKAPIVNVTNALAGQLPGLQTKQQSGMPGSDDTSLSIRGFGSPLVIVDGIESGMNNIDPNQIESISILKDGAASIYGARAGNGVILVTTKRGTEQKPTISYNGSFTLQGVTEMIKPASAGQWMQMERETHLQSGKPEESAPWTEEIVNKYLSGTDPAYQSYDWFNYVLRNWAPQHNHNVSVRGGSKRIKYMGYFGYTDQETMIRKNGGNYKRYNIQSNMDAAITDRINLTIDLLLNYEDRNFPIRGLQTGSYFWNDLYATRPWYPYEFPDPTKIAWGGIDIGSAATTSNIALTGYNRNKSRDLRGSVSLSYDFKYVKGLKAKAFINYKDNEQYVKQFNRPVEFYTYNPSTEVYTYAGNYKETAELREYMYKDNVLTQQYSLTYDQNFNDIHRVSGLALFESIDYSNNNFMAYRGNFLTPSIEQMYAGSTIGMGNNGSASEMGRASFVLRLNYGYKDKYLIETIMRADASAKFPKSSRWGYFPSVSLGWVISQESFLKDNRNVDNLKLRLSYGQSGNDAVGNFQYLSGYSMRGTILLGDKQVSGLYSTGLANPFLTWEKLSIANGGVDFSFLDRKIYGTVEGFYRYRDGIPATRVNSLPSTFGSALPPENLNSLADRGFDLDLGTSGKYNDFSYEVKGNISWSRSKWIHFEEPEYEDPDQRRINQVSGFWTDRVFGYISDKLFTSQEEIDNLPYKYVDLGGNESLRPGDVKYVDLNNDGLLDWKDKTDIGMGTMPHWMYGISTNLKYKNFDLSLLFQGAFGYYTNVAIGNETAFKYNERWTEASNDPDALIPRLGGAASNGWTSDYWYKKTSYLRLKNASIGYNVPLSVLEKVGLKQARVYMAGTNLFTLSTIGEYGIDPEAPNIGNKLHNYPQQRTISLGVNLSF